MITRFTKNIYNKTDNITGNKSEKEKK